eukprot:TRINITY_DN21339_c0_g1_i6.p1 TRINITY_DN21339_c0_g1~~TRINITY_DN21339_c0_g1_i6.p1  ORF type:complete len:259 (-),score=33.24 TRINITY_DN21339_c0_g1_i6:166-942(-)
MARASRAPLAIRRGSELVYVYDRDLAERYLWSTVDKQCDKDDVQRELLSFEGDLIEIAKGLKSDTRCNSAGVALSMLKPHIRSGLCNDIRGIIRARGFSAHPTPPGKCQRVLGDLRDALSSEGLNEELNESTTDPETNEENNTKTEYFNIAVDKEHVHVEVQTTGDWFELPASAAVRSDKECQAEAMSIKKEVFFNQHEAVHHQEFKKRVLEHQARYPGGTLPRELRHFEDFVRHRSLLIEQITPTQACLSCGKHLDL